MSGSIRRLLLRRKCRRLFSDRTVFSPANKEQEELVNAIFSLPHELRAIFVMCVFQRMKNGAVAAALGTDVNFIFQLQVEARSAVKDYLETRIDLYRYGDAEAAHLQDVLRAAGFQESVVQELSQKPSSPASETGSENLLLLLLAPFGGFSFASIYR